MVLGAPALATNRFLYDSLNYDPLTDLAPVSLLCRFQNIFAVGPTSPVKSIREFLDRAKANPGMTFSSPGFGTTPHLSGELLKRMANVDITHVPYRGAAAGAVTDAIAGRVDSIFNTAASLLQTVRNGQLRALAVTTKDRFPTAPDIPALAEAGVPGFDVSSWYSLWVPAKTPPDIITKLNNAVVKALSEPEVRAKFDPLGVVVQSSTPQELSALLRFEIDRWGPIIKAAGISAGN